MQLAEHDDSKEADLKSSLEKVRKAVKTLRKLPFKKLFTLSKRTKPKLDCPTRWNSSYQMVQSLLKEREFILSITEEDSPDVIDAELWIFLEQLLLSQ